MSARKKQKTSPKGIGSSGKGATALTSPIRSSLYGEASTLRTRHDSNQPYTHIVLENLCDSERMRRIHEEAKNNMTATFKETDLFKVFQTPELATLDGSSEKMAHLLSLRSALYSAEFREFVREITGCDELTDRVDCSANAYTNGCHLLCHDDVIGTRRVSYIIYLTDPDEPWLEEDGGALELYPLDRSPAAAIVDNGTVVPSSQSLLPLATSTICRKGIVLCVTFFG